MVVEGGVTCGRDSSTPLEGGIRADLETKYMDSRQFQRSLPYIIQRSTGACCHTRYHSTNTTMLKWSPAGTGI